jgi:hypothetical protein
MISDTFGLSDNFAVFTEMNAGFDEFFANADGIPDKSTVATNNLADIAS